MTTTITNCASRTVEFVIFGLHLGGNSANQTVKVEDIAKFAHENPTLTPQVILWAEGGKTWAKGFRATKHHATLPQGVLCRIGAGPDGDRTVWERV